MSHFIESMFSVGAKPWHQLGINVQNAPSISEAIKLAGLDWNVVCKRLAVADGGTLVDAYATVRETDGAVLGVVGNRYVPFQNAEAFKGFDAFVESGLVTLETAGSVKGGKRVWVLGKIRRDPGTVVPGDTVEQYILFYHGHDGALSINYGFTPIRTVCWNTLTAAMNDKRSQLIRVRHTKGAKDTLQQIRDIMDIQNARFDATLEQYRALASKQICLKDLENFVRIVFSQPKAEEQQRENRILTSIVPLFERGRGNDMPGVKGTLWAAYNAVTEYLQHERGDNADARLDSSWFGQGATINRKALDTALELVAA